MTISEELQNSLSNMDEKWLLMIQAHYAENPKLRENRQEISDFIDSLLENRKKETQKSW